MELSEIFTTRAVKMLRNVGDEVFPEIKEPEDDPWSPSEIRTVAAGLRAYAEEIDGLATLAEADIQMLDGLRAVGDSESPDDC